MENAFHDWLKTMLPAPELIVPLGDDAAVMDWSNMANCVVTSDLLADGVHFRLTDVDAKRIGHKSLAVNLSDVAAMAATPIAAVVSFLLPRLVPDGMSPTTLAQELYAGMVPLAVQFETAIVGGDTNIWDGNLVVNVTMLAAAVDRPPLRRDTASAGDAVLVTGTLGGSLAGHHLDFVPRVREALTLNAAYALTSCIDISDGIALDARRLGAASGCGIELNFEQLPISEAAIRQADLDPGRSSTIRALSDGEDFELLFTATPAVAERILADQPLDIPISVIGSCIAEPGLYQCTADGRVPVQLSGYEHQ